MGLPLRITFKDEDYVYQINNTTKIDQNTTELDLILNGENIKLIKNIKQSWVQSEGENPLDPELVQALGRSVSLRLRM